MLVSVTFNNAFIFSHKEQFSLKADLRSKKLLSNVIQTEADSVLKSACIYGPNNSGKTCLVKVLRAIWSVILNQPGSILPNLFTDNPVVAIGCRFLEDNEEWEYTFKLDFRNTVFVYEKFSRIDFDVHHNEKPTVYYERDFEKNIFFSKDEKLQESLTLMGKNNILLHVVDSSSLPYLQKAKNILTKFASRIIIVDMNNIPLDQTIEILKNHDNIQDDIEQIEFRRRGYDLLRKHLAELPERDREILRARRLSDPVATLESLSQKYGISRERVRQIEERAYNKLRDAILKEAKE